MGLVLQAEGTASIKTKKCGKSTPGTRRATPLCFENAGVKKVGRSHF